MKDLYDLEFQRKEWINNIGYGAAIVFGGLAYAGGWGWWSLGVVLGIVALAVALTKRIERRYDLIRVENSFREDEELWGIGWDTRREAAAHLKSTPRYWQETHRVMPYINRDGIQRWGVCNKPQYWRDAGAQEAVRKQHPPTPEEEHMMRGMQARLAREAWERGSPYAKPPSD